MRRVDEYRSNWPSPNGSLSFEFPNDSVFVDDDAFSSPSMFRFKASFLGEFAVLIDLLSAIMLRRTAGGVSILSESISILLHITSTPSSIVRVLWRC